MKTALYTLMSLFFSISTALWSQTATTPSTGDGSEGSPYQIATWQNLYWISQNPSEWGNYFTQTADIDLPQSGDDDIHNWDSGAGWTPIGNHSNTFSGSYDGQGYTVSGVFIDRSSSDYVGMFGETVDANISDLGLLNADVSGKGYVGAPIGYASTGTVVNRCFSSAGSVSSSGYHAGGLVGQGYKYSGGNGTNFNQPYTSGSVSGTYKVGGFIGTVNNDWVDVKDCYSRASVTGDTDIGGFAGYMLDNTNARRCYSTGSVSGTTSVGGFVGYFRGNLTACFWDTETSGTSTGIGNGSSLNLSGKTTSEMQTQSTFTGAGWDFTNVWEMIGSNYPRLRENQDSSLPVELADFTAEYVNGAVLLRWVAESEVKNLGFIVERRLRTQEEWKRLVSFQEDDCLKGQGTTPDRTEYYYKDTQTVLGNMYCYRLLDVDYSGFSTVNIEIQIELRRNSTSVIPDKYGLLPVYPNPFNPTTTINFEVAAPAHIQIKIYNMRGKLVHTLKDEHCGVGTYSVEWEGRDITGAPVSSGVYFTVLTVNGGQSNMVKMVKLN